MTGEQFKESACSCACCVQMCRTSPCMPLPGEARKLIEAGYADRLMFRAAFFVLSPARKGCEGEIYRDQVPRRECTFLTADSLCELHDKGLKPYEGRMLSCADPVAPVVFYVLSEWRRQAEEGDAVVRLWLNARTRMQRALTANVPFLRSCTKW